MYEATKDAILYNEKFSRLRADGGYNTVTALFNEGESGNYDERPLAGNPEVRSRH